MSKRKAKPVRAWAVCDPLRGHIPIRASIKSYHAYNHDPVVIIWQSDYRSMLAEIKSLKATVEVMGDKKFMMAHWKRKENEAKGIKEKTYTTEQVRKHLGLAQARQAKKGKVGK